MQLAGRSVLITGAGSGIGRALALQLAARGARLLLTGRREAPLQTLVEEIAATGGQARHRAGDVRDAADRRSALAAAQQAYGSLDLLVNNAGGLVAGRLEQMAEADIRALLEVDLLAPILLTAEALPLLRTGGEGLVVNLSSGLGLIGMPFYSVYGAAKAGLARFGEALRRELAGESLRVLTVFPAATETPMMASAGSGAPRQSAEAVAAEILAAIECDAAELILGGAARLEQLHLNQQEPATLDARIAAMKPALEAAAKGHRSL